MLRHRRDVRSARIYHAHLVRERLGLLQGAKITDEAGATRVWPGDADLKAQTPGRHIVGEHPVNVARLGSRCTADHPPTSSGQGGLPGVGERLAIARWDQSSRSRRERGRPGIASGDRYRSARHILFCSLT
jgi:hypothetical protein